MCKPLPWDPLSCPEVRFIEIPVYNFSNIVDNRPLTYHSMFNTIWPEGCSNA